jgi:hypothetical protein
MGVVDETVEKVYGSIVYMLVCNRCGFREITAIYTYTHPGVDPSSLP